MILIKERLSEVLLVIAGVGLAIAVCITVANLPIG